MLRQLKSAVAASSHSLSLLPPRVKMYTIGPHLACRQQRGICIGKRPEICAPVHSVGIRANILSACNATAANAATVT